MKRNMKIKTLLLILTICAAGCGGLSSSGASQTVIRWQEHVARREYGEALRLHSRAMINRMGGEDAARSALSDEERMYEDARRSNKTVVMNIVSENVTGDRAEVVASFSYREVAAGPENDIRYTFRLVQENGEWKIDNINVRIGNLDV